MKSVVNECNTNYAKLEKCTLLTAWKIFLTQFY